MDPDRLVPVVPETRGHGRLLYGRPAQRAGFERVELYRSSERPALSAPRNPRADIPAEASRSRPWFGRPRFATVRRARELFAAFRVEQSEPERFYRLMADDSVAQLEQFVALDGRTVLDIGGGPGYFARAFRARDATYVSVDIDGDEVTAAGPADTGTVLGSGMCLPFATDSIDVCYSSNVLEHVSAPGRMAEEMLRVTKPGGTVFISYTNWLSPWGGHETAPWHYLGGARAARRYARKAGSMPKNQFGQSLFSISAGSMVSWAGRTERSGRAQVVAVFPRYHPGWAHWIARVPGVREFAVWNLVIVLRRTG